MTTAAPPKNKAGKSPLAQLEKFEAEAAKAKARDSEISRELHAKTQRFTRSMTSAAG